MMSNFGRNGVVLRRLPRLLYIETIGKLAVMAILSIDFCAVSSETHHIENFPALKSNPFDEFFVTNLQHQRRQQQLLREQQQISTCNEFDGLLRAKIPDYASNCDCSEEGLIRCTISSFCTTLKNSANISIDDVESSAVSVSQTFCGTVVDFTIDLLPTKDSKARVSNCIAPQESFADSTGSKFCINFAYGASRATGQTNRWKCEKATYEGHKCGCSVCGDGMSVTIDCFPNVDGNGAKRANVLCQPFNDFSLFVPEFFYTSSSSPNVTPTSNPTTNPSSNPSLKPSSKPSSKPTSKPTSHFIATSADGAEDIALNSTTIPSPIIYSLPTTSPSIEYSFHEASKKILDENKCEGDVAGKSLFLLSLPTLVLLLFFERVRDYLDVFIKERPVYSALVNLFYRESEYFLKLFETPLFIERKMRNSMVFLHFRNNASFYVLPVATLSIVQLIIDFIRLFSESENTLDLIDLLSSIQMTVVIVALIDCFQTVLLYYLTRIFSQSSWEVEEKFGINHYIEVKREFDQLDQYLYGELSLNRFTCWANDSNFILDGSPYGSWKEELQVWIRFPFLKMKYNRLLSNIRFHAIRMHILQINDLPPNFKVGTYFLKKQQGQFIDMITKSNKKWVFLIFVQALLYWLWEFFLAITTKQESAIKILNAICWAYIIIVTVIGIALYFKVETILKKTMYVYMPLRVSLMLATLMLSF